MNQNFIDLETWAQKWQHSVDVENLALSSGHASVGDAYNAANRVARAEVNGLPSDAGVCATIRLQLNQDAVITRSGFEATLQLVNNSVDTPLANLQVDISIYDAFGNDASSLFAITATELSAETGHDNSGEIAANSSGIFKWFLVSMAEAATEGATEYFVNGTLSYTCGESRVTTAFAPAPIVVYPQPELELRYFLQRDVISDDPHTDEIEPAEPFTLAVMVQNNGAGDARNLRIESARPRIIENEKGLLIDFEILGTQVNGQDVQRSLTANFGTIAAGDIGIAQWQMEASLQGLFTEYNATFEHVSPFGDNRFSLIKNVAIHELIRVVDASQMDGDDGLPDFLVNDLPDPNDLPDTLYLSDGSVMDVGRGDNVVVGAIPTLANLRIDVTAEMTSGWSYLRMDDPSLGGFVLIGVERSDGSVLPPENFWQTDRTFIGSGQRPVIEDRIHLLDYNSTGSYTFIFSNGDLVGPEVKTFAGVLPNPTTQAIDAIDVTFTEALRDATFTASAVQLAKNGGLVDLSGVTIDRLTDSTYRIRGLLPFTADDAIYELSVDAREVTDLVGNAGTERESYRWVKGESVPTILQVEGLPQVLSRSGVDWIDLVMSKPIDLESLTIGDLSLSRNSVELLDSEVTITQIGDTTYRIGNLERLTGVDGEYRFVFDAASIEDTSGVAGLGDAVAQWTLDTTAPQLVAVVPPATNPRNIVVQRIDIEFSEPIDINSLDVSDLALIRDGGSENLLAGDSRIFFEHRFDNVYRIHGLNWVQGFIADPQVATFTFTMNGTGVSDPAGNFGSGVLSASWTIDLDRPEPATDLSLSTASGPVLNGRVNSFDARLSGLLAEPGLTVAIRDMRAGSDLLRAFVPGIEFDLPIRFSSTGQQQLRIRVIDPAGNTTDTFMDDLFVTSEPPLIQSITGLPSGAIREPFESIDVIFTKPIDTQSLTPQSFSLTANDRELIDSEVTITPVGERTYRIGNLRRLIVADGNYVLSVDTSQIQDLAGNQGTETITIPWTFDSTPPTSSVSAFPATVTASHFNVFWAGTDGSSGSGVQSYSIHVSTDGGPFEVWLNNTEASSALFEGRPGRSYAFYSVASDRVGNQETKVPLMEASTSVFVSTAWQNPFNRYDVDDNGEVVPLDALLILIQVARSRSHSENVFPEEFQTPYYDVNGDARIEPLDALLTLIEIARKNLSSNPEGEIAPPLVIDYGWDSERENDRDFLRLPNESFGGGDAKVASFDWDDDQWNLLVPAVADGRNTQPDDEDDGRELADAVWGHESLFW
jgi:hypothetical protein